MSMPRYAQDLLYNPNQSGGNFDWNKFGMSSALGGLGAGLGSLFMGSGKNPADSSNDYFNKIPGELHGAFDPWVQQGLHSGETLNQIGQNYHQSPGFQFALQQALQGGQHGAAAGGMAGSPQAMQQQMQLATQLANQDYNNWIQNALGIRQGGQQAGMGLGENLASNLAQQGQYAYAGQAGQNQADQAMWGNLLGGAASILPFLL